MNALITEDLVRLDVDLGTEKYDAIAQLAAVAQAAGRTDDVAQLTADAHAREDTAPTGLPGGIAIPHCRTAGVTDPTLVFARLNPPVDFGAKDGPADIAFLIAAPDGGDATHLQLLTKLARALVRTEFTDGLRAAQTPADVVALVNEAVGETPTPAAAPAPAPAAPDTAAAGTPLIADDLVRLDVDLGTEKYDAIAQLAAVAQAAGRTDDVAQLTADAHAREDTAPTGLPGGIAIPHCRTAGVTDPTLVFARLNPPVDFGAKDGPADIAFLIAAPDGGDATHLQLLTKLARALVRTEFTDGLRAAQTPADVVALVNEAVGETPAPAAAPAPAAEPAAASDETTEPAAAPASGPLSIVAVTACAAGIAHTYMAAEALENAAAKAGVEIHVETQGSAGATPLDPALITGADAVIFACDVGVRDRHRFAGKPMVSSGVKRPIEEGDEMIAEAIRYAADPANSPKVEGEASAAGASGGAADESWGSRVRRVLMTGVSYMIPFVAAGGLLIALGFLLGGYDITEVAGTILGNNTLFNPPDISAIPLDDGGTFALEHALFGSAYMAYLGALLFTLGGTAFGFLVPALAGYIAYAMADRPGIAPGFVMGSIALTINAGFLGGIVGGALAGAIAHWISGWKVPSWARGLMPVLVIPLLTTLFSGFLMIVVLGKPLSGLMDALETGLGNMQGGSAILLGAILGLMMAFDMGGPLNKTAYAFATTGLGTAAAAAGNAPELRIMAAVMLAGMVPPLALALATVIRPGLFTVPERENGKAAWLMGASFITEGAIPFAAADPLRIIPPIMVGSAVTGGISMALDVGLRAPHGGIFVIFAVINILGFLIALVVGSIVGAAGVVLLKSLKRSEPATV